MLRRRPLLLGLALAGCSPPPTLPPVPHGVTRYDRVPGDAAATLDWRALSGLLDVLEPRFGKVSEGKLSIFQFEAERGVERGALERHYAAALVPHGMAPLQLSSSPGSWAFAYASAGGLFSRAQVLAVEARPPRDGDLSPIFPLNVVTSLRPA